MILENNIILGNYKGKVIVQNEIGTLFYFESEIEFMIGSVIESDLLQSLSSLTLEEQEEIKEIYL